MPTRPHPSRLTGPAALLLAAGLAGCGAGSSAPAASGTTAAAVTGNPTAAATSAPARSVSATPATAATTPAVATPAVAATSTVQNGVATCTSLPASRVGPLLGVGVAAGVADHRTSTDGRRQLDGCSYTGPGGIRLDYVVWQLPSGDTRATVLQGLPPAVAGVQAFTPGVGTLSAGAVMMTGPVATAQVNAAGRGRLVQVSTTATTEATARAAATAAARALLGG